MNLPETITINTTDGQTTIDRVNIITIDDSANKRVLVRLYPLRKPLLIWQKDAYDQAGDYTQQQLEDVVYDMITNGDLTNNLQALA